MQDAHGCQETEKTYKGSVYMWPNLNTKKTLPIKTHLQLPKDHHNRTIGGRMGADNSKYTPLDSTETAELCFYNSQLNSSTTNTDRKTTMTA